MKNILFAVLMISSKALAVPYTLLLESSEQYNKVIVKDTKADVNAEVIQINPLSNKENQHVNKMLINEVLNTISMVDEMAQENETNFYLEKSESVIELNKDFLTTLSTGSQYTGGAHPMHYMVAMTLDLKKAAKAKTSDDFAQAYISWEDTIIENKLEATKESFKSALLNKVNTDENCKDEELTIESIWVGNVALTSKGLIVNTEFPHAFSVCNTQIEIPYTKIKSVLKPGSLAAQLAK